MVRPSLLIVKCLLILYTISAGGATDIPIELPAKQRELPGVLPFLIPAIRASKKPRWPTDFFAIDVAACFDEVEDTGRSAEATSSVFERRFGQWASYKKSTFYEHRQRWETVLLENKQVLLSAGRTEAGCWINVMSVAAPPRAHLKAVRKYGILPRMQRTSSCALSEPEN
jgi:hypothetical protein